MRNANRSLQRRQFLVHLEETGDDVGLGGVLREAVGLQDGGSFLVPFRRGSGIGGTSKRDFNLHQQPFPDRYNFNGKPVFFDGLLFIISDNQGPVKFEYFTEAHKCIYLAVSRSLRSQVV